MFNVGEFIADLELNTSFLLVSGCGLATYAVFHRYEPRTLPTLALLLLAVPLCLSVPIAATYHWHEAVGISFLIYYITMYMFIFIYRVTPIHPLSRFPGPHWCKLSKLWLLLIVKTGKRYRYLKLLHEQYGDVVRIGPNELSVRDASIIKTFSTSPDLLRVPTYIETFFSASSDFAYSEDSIEAWDITFRASAQRQYIPVVDQRTTQLAQILGQHGGRQDLAQNLNYFGFDVMGDIVFGGGYELMKTVDHDGVWQSLEKALRSGSAFDTVPWLLSFARLLPRHNQHLSELLSSFRSRALRSLNKEGDASRDLLHCLVASYETLTDEDLTEVGLAMIHGSTIISSVLSNAIYYLMRHEIEYQQLQAEAKCYEEGNDQGMPVADAIILEVLRLYPPMPGGTAEAVPSGSSGRRLGSSMIPEGTIIHTQAYTAHRTSRYFSPDTDIFFPGRWLMAEGKATVPLDEDEAFIHDPEAFIPFVSSDYRLKALEGLVKMVARKALCACFKSYDFRFADGYDQNRWERGLRDVGLWNKGELYVVATPREGEQS